MPNEEKEKKASVVRLENSCIANVPIFSALDDEELLEVLLTSTHKKLKKGELLYHEGDESEKLYVISRGKVKVTKFSREGREQILRILEENDFTGELSLFSAQVAKSNAEAIETTDVCVIESGKIRELMEKRSGIAMKILTELSRRLEKTETLVETLGLMDVDEKVAKSLLAMADDHDVVDLGVTKKDLAAHIQMSPETLSRRLANFEDLGVIRQETSRRIVILKREVLEGMGTE
ncbi:MAG TPA: Crp/Fnr family transcriptional regulator [Clostridiaceae bacterium]|nr:Crp/Fnr family transcriptional regulator [Clostridiaceae bacterium]